MLRQHPLVGYGLAALLTLAAIVALLGLNGFVAAGLGALAWFALPDQPQRVRRTRRRAVRL